MPVRSFFERQLVVLLAVALAVTVSTSAIAADQSLNLHGSNTVGQRLVPALVREWAAARGYTVGEPISQAAEEVTLPVTTGNGTISVQIHSHGTGTGFADLVSGKADMWMASRPATADEIGRGRAALGDLAEPSHEHVIALDGLAVIVHPTNPLTRLGVAQVRDIFAGRIRDWSDVGGQAGTISLYARDDKSGTFDTFRSLVLRDATISSAAKRYESTDQLAADVAADPRAIGFVGLAGVGRAKPLSISDAGTRPLPPTKINVATEDYVLSRRLFLYNGSEPSTLARDFVEFALSAPGQAVVERIGFVSQNVTALAVPPRTDISDEYKELTAGAERLSLNFRFAAGRATLDNKSLRDVERLARFVREQQNGGFKITLIGFADTSEINPYHALSLSTDRADYVANALIKGGVVPRRVRGVGGTAPVAAEDSDSGRAKNRRVEVWVSRAVDRVAETGANGVRAGGS